MKKGQTVEYVGTQVLKLVGQRGTVTIGQTRKGYTEVEFGGIKGNFDPANLRVVG